jgi:hypothetical protein
MADFSLQQIFGLTPAVCSRYRNWVICLLQTTLRSFRAAQVRWPGPLNCERFAAMIARHHPLLQKAVGFVDACHLPIASSVDLVVQNAYYNGWCASHFTSNIFVFAPDGSLSMLQSMPRVAGTMLLFRATFLQSFSQKHRPATGLLEIPLSLPHKSFKDAFIPHQNQALTTTHLIQLSRKRWHNGK